MKQEPGFDYCLFGNSTACPRHATRADLILAKRKLELDWIKTFTAAKEQKWQSVSEVQFNCKRKFIYQIDEVSMVCKKVRAFAMTWEHWLRRPKTIKEGV